MQELWAFCSTWQNTLSNRVRVVIEKKQMITHKLLHQDTPKPFLICFCVYDVNRVNSGFLQLICFCIFEILVVFNLIDFSHLQICTVKVRKKWTNLLTNKESILIKKHPKNWETALWGKEMLNWKKGFIETKLNYSRMR